jgi:hypothetical protein
MGNQYHLPRPTENFVFRTDVLDESKTVHSWPCRLTHLINETAQCKAVLRRYLNQKMYKCWAPSHPDKLNFLHCHLIFLPVINLHIITLIIILSSKAIYGWLVIANFLKFCQHSIKLLVSNNLYNSAKAP